MINLILTDQHFAIARAMNFDGGIIGVLLGGALVAKQQGAPTGPQDFTGSLMIGWIKTECLGRATREDESLDKSVRCPGFVTAWFYHDRNFQWDGWKPERIDGRGIARHDQSESGGGRVEADGGTGLHAETTVENGKIQPTRESMQDSAHVCESVMDFGHVSTDHDVGKAAGGGKGPSVFVGRLR